MRCFSSLHWGNSNIKYKVNKEEAKFKPTRTNVVDTEIISYIENDKQTEYYRSNKSKTHCRGQSGAFIFTAWGISPTPFYSKEVPVVLG
jgi:hypothetical protein